MTQSLGFYITLHLFLQKAFVPIATMASCLQAFCLSYKPSLSRADYRLPLEHLVLSIISFVLNDHVDVDDWPKPENILPYILSLRISAMMIELYVYSTCSAHEYADDSLRLKRIDSHIVNHVSMDPIC